MSVGELIVKLKRYPETDEVMLLDHRCENAFPTDISIVRRAKKSEADQILEDKPVIID